MRRKRKSSSFEEPNINLTPLIDVVFVVLFTFIVVAPLLEVDQVKLASGPHLVEKSVSPDAASPIAIHVFENNSVAFNNKHVALGDLEKILRKARRQFPNAHPQLFHDKKAEFGTYQTVKNAVENAGFSQMDVILKP